MTQDSWLPYQDIDFSNEKNNCFSIDTRDFHGNAFSRPGTHPDFDTLKKYPDFFHTEAELRALLDRFFVESGGEGPWRMFSLVTGNNWDMKYIKIWRTPLGFVVCTRHDRALTQTSLSNSVDQTYLHFCKK